MEWSSMALMPPPPRFTHPHSITTAQPKAAEKITHNLPVLHQLLRICLHEEGVCQERVVWLETMEL